MSTNKCFFTAAFCFAALLPGLSMAQGGAPTAPPTAAEATPTAAAPLAATTAAGSPTKSASQNDLITIGSLADAQRKALLAKEREARSKSAPPKEAQDSSRRIVMPKLPPQKSRLVYGIYTNKEGELIAEIVHNDHLKQVRDGQSVGGIVIEIPATTHVVARGVSDTSCAPKKPCPTRDLTLRIGQAF